MLSPTESACAPKTSRSISNAGKYFTVTLPLPDLTKPYRYLVSKSEETLRVGFLVLPSGAVLGGAVPPPTQECWPGLPGTTRQRVGFPLQILD